MTIAQKSKQTGPAIHPNWEVLQARDRTPAPIMAVMIWATALHKVPGIIGGRTKIQDSNSSLWVWNGYGMVLEIFTSPLGTSIIIITSSTTSSYLERILNSHFYPSIQLNWYSWSSVQLNSLYSLQPTTIKGTIWHLLEFKIMFVW